MNIRDNANEILAQLDQEQRRAQRVEMIRHDEPDYIKRELPFIAPDRPKANKCIRVLKWIGLTIVAIVGLIAFSLWVIVMVAKYQ